jgi:hypothetical protein
MARSGYYECHLRSCGCGLVPPRKLWASGHAAQRRPEKSPRYTVQTISLSATMIPGKGRIFFSLWGPPTAGMALKLHLVFCGGVPPVREPRTAAAGRSGLCPIPRTGTFKW